MWLIKVQKGLIDSLKIWGSLSSKVKEASGELQLQGEKVRFTLQEGHSSEGEILKWGKDFSQGAT